MKRLPKALSTAPANDCAPTPDPGTMRAWMHGLIDALDEETVAALWGLLWMAARGGGRGASEAPESG